MKRQTKLDIQQNNEYKQTELGLLPKEWKVVRLWDVTEIYDKKRVPLSETQRNKMQGNYPYCGANGIIDYINDYIFDGEYLLLAEDGGFWNKFQNTAYIMNGKFWVNNHAHILQAIPNKTTNKFLLYWFVYDDIEGYTSGTTRKKLNQGVMKQIKIPLPPLPEQKAIAFVLSTIQTAKEKTEKVIQATKELKKSMMKHLFTYGPVSLEDAEKVKLKETEIGKMPEEWEVVRLGEVTDLQQGKTPRSEDYDNLKGFRIIKVKDFEDGSKISFGIKGERNFVKCALGERYTLKKGDSLVLSAAHSSNIVGQKIGYVEEVPCEAYFVAELIRVRPSKDLNPYLCFSILNLEGSRKQIKEEVKGGHLYPRNLGKIKIPLPPLQTQQKIASILSAIDEKIQAEENKKKALEESFKSMLHNLMTAKIRVKDFKVAEAN